MGWRLQKSRDEIMDFWQEIVVENGPRYRLPGEWPHLYLDILVSFFSMSYTLGHIVGIGAPIIILLLLL